MSGFTFLNVVIKSPIINGLQNIFTVKKQFRNSRIYHVMKTSKIMTNLGNFTRIVTDIMNNDCLFKQVFCC